MSQVLFTVAILSLVLGAISRALQPTHTRCTLIQPSDADLCGVFHSPNLNPYNYGHSYSYERPGNRDEPIFVNSIEDCAEICARRLESVAQNQTDTPGPYGEGEFCRSFSFDIESKTCQVSQFSVPKPAQKSTTSSIVFYDSSCYDCGQFCNQPYGANVLDNGGFENSLFGPWRSDGGSFGVGHHSEKCWFCSGSRSFPGCLLEQAFNICQGHLYAFQFDYKLDARSNPAEFCRVQLSIGGVGLAFDDTGYGRNADNQSVNYVSYGYPITTSEWITSRGYFLAESIHRGALFYLEDLEEQECEFYIDNVRIVHTPQPSAKLGAQSAIVNGGFETGKIAPFHVPRMKKVDLTVGLVSPGLNSSKHAYNYYTDSDDGLEASFTLAQRKLMTKPNTTYLFTFDALAGTDVIWIVKMKFGRFSGDQFLGPFQGVVTFARVEPGFQTVSMPVFVERAEINFEVSFIQDNEANSGFGTLTRNLTVDNFALREVSNPSPFI